MFRCLRCGLEEARREARQIHCLRCTAEVTALVESDRKRRLPRFPGKDMTGRVLSGLPL